MYSKIFRNILFPVMEIYNGTKIHKNLALLNKTQWWSKEQLEELQNKKLRALIKHAYNNVPYYHDIFQELELKPDDIKCKDDLSRLPILTKEDIKNNYNKIKSQSKFSATSWSSGGSTGEPLQFLRSKDDVGWAWAAAFRGWNWAGYEIGDKYITLWGSPIAYSNQNKFLKQIKNYLRRNILLSAYEITDANILDYIRIIKKYEPRMIRGYSQAIYLLTRYLEKNGISDIHPTAILTTAETLFSHQRKIIESQFGCEVFDGYGGGEAPSAAYECEEHCGYHISAENMIIEFIKDGEHVAPGEMGKIVVTNLNSHAMPFIRYEMGDIGKPSPDSCPCGRGLPMMASVEGRINDFVTTSNGKLVHSYFFTALLKDFAGVDQFQVIQETIGKINIKIIKNNRFTVNDLSRIKNEIQNKVGIGTEINIEFVNEIPLLSRSGKRRYVISKVPLNI